MSADIATQTDASPRLLGSLLKDERSKRKSPLVEEAYYSEAIAVLASLRRSTHPVWAILKRQLEETPKSERSKSALYEKLMTACAEEDLDWMAFDFIKRGYQHGPKMLSINGTVAGLYKLMGALPNKLNMYLEEDLYRKAVFLDEILADSIFLFVELLKIARTGVSNHEDAQLHLMLQDKWLRMESLLMKTRGAPKIRQFMELWDEAPTNGSDDDGDGNVDEDVDDDSEEEEPPSQKRRCIEGEKFE